MKRLYNVLATSLLGALVFLTTAAPIRQVDPTTFSADSYTFQPSTDSTTFIQVLDADGGTPILNIDSTNERVGIGTASPLLPLDVAGSGRFTGDATSVLTGSIDPTASTAVVGVGTLFTTELVVGDRITVSAETRTVTAITDALNLTVDTAFTDTANDASPDKLAAILVTRLADNSIGMVQNDLGNFGFGTAAPGAPIHIKSGNGGGGYTTTHDEVIIEDDDFTYLNLVSGTSGATGLWFSDNAYQRGGLYYTFSDDKFQFYQAGGIKMVIDGGNVGIGILTFGTNLAGGIAIANGTAATTTITDGVQLWADDFAAGDSRLYIQSEADATNLVIIGDGKVLLPLENDETAPSLAFGDGGDGIYSSSDAEVRVALNGASKWVFDTAAFYPGSSNWGAFMNENPTATNPVFVPKKANPTTGIGNAASDNMSLIGGGVETQRINSTGTRMSGKTSFSNTAEGNTGTMNIQTAREVHTLTLGTTSDTTINLGSGVLLLGASLTVNTAVTDDAGDDTWTAKFNDGSDMHVLASGAAAAQNTKANQMVDAATIATVTDATTNIQFTPNGGSFSAGVIEVIIYYIDLTNLGDV